MSAESEGEEEENSRDQNESCNYLNSCWKKLVKMCLLQKLWYLSTVIFCRLYTRNKENKFK